MGNMETLVIVGTIIAIVLVGALLVLAGIGISCSI